MREEIEREEAKQPGVVLRVPLTVSKYFLHTSPAPAFLIGASIYAYTDEYVYFYIYIYIIDITIITMSSNTRPYAKTIHTYT